MTPDLRLNDDCGDRESQEGLMPSIAVITPTIGRSSFRATSDSVLPQLTAADEWWVIGDGPQLRVRRDVRKWNHPAVRYFEHRNPQSRYGNAQRNAAMLRSQADYFVFLDDDDTLLPGALDAVRREASSGQPLMFKMDHGPLGTVLWHDQELRVGNVGGAMFVVPNVPGKWAPWPDVILDQPVADKRRYDKQSIHAVRKWQVILPVGKCERNGCGQQGHQVERVRGADSPIKPTSIWRLQRLHQKPSTIRLKHWR